MAGENLDLIGALADLEQERGIDRETLLLAVEAALISAYRRNYGTTENVGVRIDRDNGQMDIYVQKRIVDEVADPDQEISIADAQAFDPSYQTGDIIEFPVLVKDFGRIAAQTAKQVVVQRIREAERGMIFDEYVQREGDIITGVVQRVQGRTAFIDLGKAEAVLPAAEVPPGEYYNPGDRVKVYLVEVRRTNKGPQLLVSRTHPGLLKRLFELEVPEIHDGLVEVKGIAREAGTRSKFAVFSRDDHIDPVGACVGHKGMRVQAVVNELRGEKIDIIKWSPDPVEYVGNALSPSKVSQVLLREEDKVARVIVPDYQLSLAIGRAGQNARLAAKLTGWRIDIRSESQVLEEGGELAPAGVGVATPAVPWAGGLGVGTGRGATIAAPWAVPGPEVPEAAEGAPVEGAPAEAAGIGEAAEAAEAGEGVEAAAAAEAGGDAMAAAAAAEAGAPGDVEPAGELAGQAGGEAAAEAGQAGDVEAAADATGAAEGAAAPADAAEGAGTGAGGPSRRASRRITMAPATGRAKPKKKAAPKARDAEKVIHGASLAEALAKAGLAQGEAAEGAAAADGADGAADGAAAAAGEAAKGARGKRGASRRAGARAGAGDEGAGGGSGTSGSEVAAGRQDVSGAAETGDAGEEAVESDDDHDAASAGGGRRGRGGAAAGRRGRGRGRLATDDADEQATGETGAGAIDEETLDALEQKATPAGRRVQRTRRARDEGTPLAREEE